MHVTILGQGSRGDVQPLLAVAAALTRRGNTVTLAAPENLARWVGERSFEVVSLPGDSEEFLRSDEGQAILADGRVGEMFRRVEAKELELNDAFIEACSRAARGADIVLSTPIALVRGVILAEKLGVPHRPLYFAPSVATRDYPHYALPFATLGWGTLNAWSYDALRKRLWKLIEPRHNAMRVALDLPPWRSPPLDQLELGSINLFSETLVPRPRDWGPAHRIAGFARLSDEDRAGLLESTSTDSLEAWLDSGDAPVFFGFGSMPVFEPRNTLSDIENLCARLHVRALIGAGWTEFGEGTSDDVFIARSFDHERILPRCRAAVHHGGAGTTHTALRADLPALVCSFLVDQPFWGRRLKRLGVGASLPFKKLDLQALCRMLPPLLDEDVQARAAILGARLRAEEGATRAAELIEQVVAER